MSIPEIQSTEIELYLAKIAGKSVTLPETQNTRAEKFLAKIAGENVVIPIDQRTRLELFLAKWAGSSVNLPADAPINRIEHYLMYIMGESETKPEYPENEIEVYLDAIEGGGLPAGWTQVEYIASNGDAYLDLGYKGGENTKVEVEFNYPAASSATGSGRLFGSRTNSTTNAFAVGTATGLVANTGNAMFWCYDNQPFYSLSNDKTFAAGTWHSVVFSATEHKFDGVSYGTDYTPTEFTTPSNLTLFGFENNGTFGNGIVRSRKLKLWDGTTLLRDLIPVKNDTTSEYAMYDRVSGEILHNAGTGDFTGA